METSYEKRKKAAREKAINFQYEQANMNLSWLEVSQIASYFYKLCRRYGLVREFRENGLI